MDRKNSSRKKKVSNMSLDSKIITTLDAVSGYVRELRDHYEDIIKDKTFKLLVDNLNDKVELLKFYIMGSDDVYDGDGEDGDVNVIVRQNIRKISRKSDPIEQTILDLEELKKRIQNERGR